MEYKRILTIQDISCVGQCSLTVALPILSACGVETCVLPSAVLSTHTAGFQGYTFRDLTDDMPAIAAHWQAEGITFDAMYTGYLGSADQVQYVCAIADACLADGGALIVDPAMADNGKLYTGFDAAFVESMKTLCAKADYLVPNITEACFLTAMPYRENYDEAYIDELVSRLLALGCRKVVLTGVSYDPAKTGVLVSDGTSSALYAHDKLPNSCHGTGDVYASAFTGALVRGHDPLAAATIAADFTTDCIAYTATLDNHWYGAAFEPMLPRLIARL